MLAQFKKVTFSKKMLRKKSPIRQTKWPIRQTKCTREAI